MEFRPFDYVLKVAEKRNFTKAASELYISQPSLSQYISSIESELGIKLFDRSTSPLQLTPAGEIYITYAKSILNTYASMLQDLSKINQKQQGTIKIALSNFRCSCVIPNIISNFKKLYPNVNLILLEQNFSTGKALVESEEADFAVVTSPIDNPDLFDSYFICNEKILLALPPEHPFNKKQKKFSKKPSPVDLSQFREDNFVLLTQNQKMYKLAIELCKKSGFFPKIALQTPLMISSYSLMKAGVGLAFIPDTLLKVLDDGENFCAYSISPFYPNRDVLLIRKRSLTPTSLQQSFIDYIKTYSKQNN